MKKYFKAWHIAAIMSIFISFQVINFFILKTVITNSYASSGNKNNSGNADTAFKENYNRWASLKSMEAQSMILPKTEMTYRVSFNGSNYRLLKYYIR